MKTKFKPMTITQEAFAKLRKEAENDSKIIEALVRIYKGTQQAIAYQETLKQKKINSFFECSENVKRDLALSVLEELYTINPENEASYHFTALTLRLLEKEFKSNFPGKIELIKTIPALHEIAISDYSRFYAEEQDPKYLEWIEESKCFSEIWSNIVTLYKYKYKHAIIE